MLSYPDRNTFEQIRARWEGAQLAEDATSEMVGRKEKQAPQQPVDGEPFANSGSKFRRKLSHFISHPLSQRKSTPRCHQMTLPSPALSQPTTTKQLTETYGCDASLSPDRDDSTSERSNGLSTTPTATVSSVYPDTTPKPLPRYRTLSYIPRPIRVESQLSATDVEEPVKVDASTLMKNLTTRATASKIPTPSPPLSTRRRSSPRQYLLHYASQPAKHIVTAHPFAGIHNTSPSKFTVRSHTTPNLVMGANSPPAASFMASGNTRRNKAVTSSIVQKRVLQENVPINKRATETRTLRKDEVYKRQSLATPTTMPKRMSLGPDAPLQTGSQPNPATTPTGRKRLSSLPAQPTPVTVKRIDPNEYIERYPAEPFHLANGNTVAQLRLMGPRNPPTPTPHIIDLQKPNLPCSGIEKDPQREKLETSNNLGSVWRSSRSSALKTHEVRRLPRASTFHNFGFRQECPVPVPPIPDQYMQPSLSNLTQYLRMSPVNPVKPRPVRITSDAASCESIPEETDEIGHGRSVYTPWSWGEREQYYCLDCSILTTSFTSPTVVPSTFISLANRQSAQTKRNTDYPVDNSDTRSWPVSGYHCLENADIDPLSQVKDYMPPLYWAGRFQSRFDQWRTEAMRSEINPDHQMSGPLGEYKLNQEHLAVCCIFAQLRALCASNQAAESLCVSLLSISSFSCVTNHLSRNLSLITKEIISYSTIYSILRQCPLVNLTIIRLT